MDRSHGIELYYENKKDVNNTVFFPDGSYTFYGTGGMLFEHLGSGNLSDDREGAEYDPGLPGIRCAADPRDA